MPTQLVRIVQVPPVEDVTHCPELLHVRPFAHEPHEPEPHELTPHTRPLHEQLPVLPLPG